jgi:thiamine-monophosphate kinase
VSSSRDEFDLIACIRTRAGKRDDVLLGIGDDAAILRMRAGHDLVVSTDALNAGVHFPDDTAPFDIGWKSLAVNLSDLAAMGAEPAWCTLNLSLPNADAAWLDAFLDGFLALATQHRVALVGGDTTRGPLSSAVTAHGFVPHDEALRRSSAKVGDEIWVSGTLGDAAGALRQWRDGAAMDTHLRECLDRPTPRVALGLALRSIANACIDVSDGLLADLGHVLDESRVGAQLELDSLPSSTALTTAFDAATRRELQLGGGDDYELCFTAPSARANDVIAAETSAGVTATRIGRVESKPGLRLREADGGVREAKRSGYVHFDAKDGI